MTNSATPLVCIGGSQDGKVKHIPRGASFVVWRSPVELEIKAEESNVPDVKTSEETYTLRALYGQQQAHRFLALSSLSQDQAIHRLLHNYRPNGVSDE